MKKTILVFLLVLCISSTFVSCKHCSKCHPEFLGNKGPEQEYCGDNLDKVKDNPGMVCDDK